MDLALEQGEVEKRIQAVQEEVKKQDEAVKELQKKLKVWIDVVILGTSLDLILRYLISYLVNKAYNSFQEAETVLSTAIFQAKQKLDSIERANKNPVSSEDLIKYSHRISASNAACAPLTWQQGDPRRPYPTDIEMRLGFLGRPETMLLKSSTNGSQFAIGSQLGNNTTPVSSPMVPNIHQANTSPTKIPSSQPGGSQPPHIPPGASGHFAWRDGEMSMSMTEGGTIPIEIGGNLIGSPSVNPPVGGGKGVRMAHGGQEDVDVMSTDSSSSSSTDSN